MCFIKIELFSKVRKLWMVCNSGHWARVSITRKSTQKSLVKSLKYTSDDRTEISHKHTLKCPSGTDHLPRPNRYCESPQSKGESQSIFVDYMVSRFSALIRPICEKHRHTKTEKKNTHTHRCISLAGIFRFYASVIEMLWYMGRKQTKRKDTEKIPTSTMQRKSEHFEEIEWFGWCTGHRRRNVSTTEDLYIVDMYIWLIHWQHNIVLVWNAMHKSGSFDFVYVIILHK